MRYEDAVDELYRGPHAAFIAERRRLVEALTASGDREGAARLAKVPRPTASAWAVDQLWWHARTEFEAMLATAARLRDGEFRTMPAHREAIAQLRARASLILQDAGHDPTDVVLRRVTTTLAALAVEGGFAPDRPGTLAVDRESAGFAPGVAATATISVPPKLELDPDPEREDTARLQLPDREDTMRLQLEDLTRLHAEEAAREAAEEAAKQAAAEAARQAAAEAARQAAAEAAARLAAAEAERRKREELAARRAEQRRRLEGDLRMAKDELAVAERDVAHYQRELLSARTLMEKTSALVSALTVKLAADWEDT